MGKYVFIYYNDKDADAGSMEVWMDWFKELGSKIVDPGNPFLDGGKAVTAEGVMDVKETPATGYTIVSADSQDEAIELSKGCPLVVNKSGAVCVYEAAPM